MMMSSLHHIIGYNTRTIEYMKFIFFLVFVICLLFAFSVLAMHQLTEHADCVLPVENQVGTL